MKKFGMILAFMLLAGCSWRSPNSTFYIMESNNLPVLSAKKINIAVTKVKVPDMLDRMQMVVNEKDTSQIKILEFQRWGEIYPDILQTTITNDIIAYLPNAYVRRTYFDSESASYNINIEINRVQSYPGEKVVLSAWWNIKDANGNILKKEFGTYEAKANGDKIQDLVNAQATALHQMSRQITETLLK